MMGLEKIEVTQAGSSYHVPASKVESIDLDQFEKPTDDKRTSQHDRIIRLLGRALGRGVVIVGAEGPKTIDSVSMSPSELETFKSGLSQSEIRVRERLAKSREIASA